ncbi:hypothetical protein [Cellulosimicrobium funkei]|uniref:hypothetical protein n=1 Tax=Cellulosimicrobium funkei TaxID=264251 RepID=UPI0030F9ECB6
MTFILPRNQVPGHAGTTQPPVGSWSDEKKRTLEEQLPDLFRHLDIAAAETEWERQETERRRRLVQRRWAQVRAAAVEKYRYAKRADQLEAELERRESARQMRAYADEITAGAGDLDGEGQADACAWADWIREHASKTDPLNGARLRVPAFDHFKEADLEPWLGGWTSYRPPAGGSAW